MLPIAPAVYDERKARVRDPERHPPRVRHDAWLSEEIERVWRGRREVHGVRKVWNQLKREGRIVGRCTVARLMRRLGLAGAVRGRRFRVTTISDPAAARPRGSGDAAVHGGATESAVGGRPDVRRDVAGVRVRGVRHRCLLAADRRLARVELAAQRLGALDALEQALYARPLSASEPLVHHSDRGAQYLSIRYTERLAAAGIEPSVGSAGDSYDNALAERVIGLFKTEVIRRCGPWKELEDVEFATLEWVAWYNGSRLLEPLGYVPPAEFEQAYYDRQAAPDGTAVLT